MNHLEVSRRCCSCDSFLREFPKNISQESSVFQPKCSSREFPKRSSKVAPQESFHDHDPREYSKRVGKDVFQVYLRTCSDTLKRSVLESFPSEPPKVFFREIAFRESCPRELTKRASRSTFQDEISRQSCST